MKLLEVKKYLTIELEYDELLTYLHALKLINPTNEGAKKLIEEIELILNRARVE